MRQNNYNGKSKSSRTARDFIIGALSFGIGAAIMTASAALLAQALQNHQGESGPDYDVIYRQPFKNSNWMKSSIPIIVVTSFGIVLGCIQTLASLIFIFVDGKFRILAVVIWLGAHVMVFVFNIICFSLAISVKAHEFKESSQFWKNYQFQSKLVHNPEGHAFCSIVAVNSIFILISVSITTPKLVYRVYESPIYLPPSVY